MIEAAEKVYDKYINHQLPQGTKAQYKSKIMQSKTPIYDFNSDLQD